MPFRSDSSLEGGYGEQCANEQYCDVQSHVRLMITSVGQLPPPHLGTRYPERLDLRRGLRPVALRKEHVVGGVGVERRIEVDEIDVSSSRAAGARRGCRRSRAGSWAVTGERRRRAANCRAFMPTRSPERLLIVVVAVRLLVVVRREVQHARLGRLPLRLQGLREGHAVVGRNAVETACRAE